MSIFSLTHPLGNPLGGAVAAELVTTVCARRTPFMHHPHLQLALSVRHVQHLRVAHLGPGHVQDVADVLAMANEHVHVVLGSRVIDVGEVPLVEIFRGRMRGGGVMVAHIGVPELKIKSLQKSQELSRI